MTKVCTMFNWFIAYDDNWHNHGGDVTVEEENEIVALMRQGVKRGKLATRDSNGKVHKGYWRLDNSYGVEP